MLVCLFDSGGAETQIPLLDYDAGVWHGFVPGAAALQAYGYRAADRYDPGSGLRFNPAKLILDPYARAVTGAVRFGPEVLGYADGDPGRAEHARLGRARTAQPGGGRHVRLERRRTTPASLRGHGHLRGPVKGFTMRHPGVAPELRGTYAGLGHEAAIGHLLDLGVAAVELLPVHESVPEAFLLQRGLTNYWGYNTIGYFGPRQGYSAAVRARRDWGWRLPRSHRCRGREARRRGPIERLPLQVTGKPVPALPVPAQRQFIGRRDVGNAKGAPEGWLLSWPSGCGDLTFAP